MPDIGAGVHGNGRRIEVPARFAGDSGEANPELARAMRLCAQGSVEVSEVIDLLARGARLLVPIVAVLDESEASGADKSSHMASVSLVQSDGRRGVLAFTSLASLRAWDPGARPVPALAPEVAQVAVAEGAQGLLIDVAGPVRLAVDGEALERLAAGSPPADSAHTDPH